MRCQHLLGQGHLGTFKGDANGYGELLAAIAALKEAGAMLGSLKAVALLNTATVRANRAISPTLRFHVRAVCIVVVEGRIGQPPRSYLLEPKEQVRHLLWQEHNRPNEPCDFIDSCARSRSTVVFCCFRREG